MDRIAVAGLSLHHTDVEGLERVKRAVAAGADPAPKALADRLGASELVCLSTCNRFEVLYASENGPPPSREDLSSLARGFGLEEGDPLRGRLFFHSGARAARHLFRVACSLDSLVVGEDQILAQVRAAFAESQELGLTGRILRPLLDQALQVARKVRSVTDLSRHPISVVSLGAAFIAERARQAAAPLRIAVLGAGATATHAARSLGAAGCPVSLIANRTPERAERLAREVGARAIPLGALTRGEERIDALVSCTSAPGFVLDATALLALAARTPSRGTLLAVDLAVPRDLEPPDARTGSPRLELFDLDALRARADENRARRVAAAAEAELLVDESLESFTRRARRERATGSMAAVVNESREAFELELARLTGGRLAHLGAAERRSIERWARRAFGRLSHLPLAALKRLACEDMSTEGEWEGLE